MMWSNECSQLVISSLVTSAFPRLEWMLVSGELEGAKRPTIVRFRTSLGGNGQRRPMGEWGHR